MKVISDIEHIAIKVDIGHTKSFKNTCQITSFQVYHSFVEYVHCTFRSMDPVLCRVCGQAFRNRSLLWQHELRHSKQGLYSCCNKTFFLKGTLKRHQCHQHAETCPYACDVCGKSFALQTDLRRHKARESGKLKYTCDICGF